MEHMINEIKNTNEGINSGLEVMEEQISNPK